MNTSFSLIKKVYLENIKCCIRSQYFHSLSFFTVTFVVSDHKCYVLDDQASLNIDSCYLLSCRRTTRLYTAGQHLRTSCINLWRFSVILSCTRDRAHVFIAEIIVMWWWVAKCLQIMKSEWIVRLFLPTEWTSPYFLNLRCIDLSSWCRRRFV